MKAAATTQQEPVVTLQNSDFPSFYRVADEASFENQKRYNWQVRMELILIVVGAIAGLGTLRIMTNNTMIDLAGIVAAFAFFASFLFQTTRLIQAPNRIWYNGRAIAESAKTLVWRYAVGGNPYAIDSNKAPDDDREADALLTAQYQQILKDIVENEIPIVIKGEQEQITPGMRHLRHQPLAVRQRAYAKGRISDQLEWYSNKAIFNRRRANFWSAALLFTELLGAFAAILKAVGIIQIDFLGLAATVVAAGTSWLQSKQHQTLAQSYGIASLELSMILSGIQDQQNEADWAIFVGKAEGAISREHTSWRSGHGVKLN